MTIGLPPIKFNVMLALMDKLDANQDPIPFDITFVTCDRRNKKERGRIVALKQVVCSRHLKKLPLAMRKEYVPVARMDIPDMQLRSSVRRLYVGGTPPFRNCHIRLIVEFNNQEVIW